MVKARSFGIIGGDTRQFFAARSILDDGNYVETFGVEIIDDEFKSMAVGDVGTLIKESEYIVLPLPATSDGKTLNASSEEFRIDLSDEFAEKLEGKTIFCGMEEGLRALGGKWTNLNIKDYYAREEFAVLNAKPTAEGAVQVAMNEICGTISSGRCLVTGFGRVGKVLSALLKGMGAHVTVGARKASDLAWIHVMGYEGVNVSGLPGELDYDVIFNTIPFKIFDRVNLLKCSYGTTIIDLASKPGGVDFEFAEFLGIKAVHALALPGKFSPRTAGEIIKKTIYNMIEEEDS